MSKGSWKDLEEFMLKRSPVVSKPNLLARLKRIFRKRGEPIALGIIESITITRKDDQKEESGLKKWVNLAWLLVTGYVHKKPFDDIDPLTMSSEKFFTMLIKNGRPIGPDREKVVIEQILRKELPHGIHSSVIEDDVPALVLFGYRGIACSIMMDQNTFYVIIQPYEQIYKGYSVSGLIALIHKHTGGDLRHYMNEYPAVKLKEYFADE